MIKQGIAGPPQQNLFLVSDLKANRKRVRLSCVITFLRYTTIHFVF